MRYLTLAECLPVLLRHGLISPASIVRGQVVVEDTSSRNSNRRVSRQRGAHYLLKQSTGTAQDATVQREARVYESLARIRQFSANLVRFFGYDAEEKVLILENLRDVHDLARHFSEGGKLTMSLSRAIGRALGLLHQIDVTRLDPDVALQSEAPWILSIHRPSLAFLRDVSAGNLELIRLIQATPSFCENLDAMRTSWQPRTLIHMDVRWSNWLVGRPGRPRRGSQIKLLDWETACCGDPCWDVGCALSDNLTWWALQAPETGGEVFRRRPPKDETQTMQRAVRAFWRQYCASALLESREREPFLARALKYAGGRLLQSAYERLQQRQSIDRFGLSLLQLSANILQFPEAALERLCGFARVPHEL